MISMTNQEGVNWVTVLNFLQKEQMMSTAREKQWSLQKYQLIEKIKRLEAELDGNKIIITDLLNRIKLLQIALLQIKTQKGKGNNIQFKQQDFSKVQSLLSKFHLEEKVEEGDEKQFLNKILSQIGIDSRQVFSSTNSLNIQETIFKKQSNFKIRQTGAVTAHLDAVRGIFVNDTKDFLVTVSQDCLVKIWPYQTFIKNKYDYIQPSKTFRQHAGPLLSIDGGLSPFNPQQSIFFTGGSDGLIKYWKIGHKSYQHQMLSPISAWSCSKNTDKDVTVWDLSLNNNKLLCSASDGYINYYEIGQTEGSILKNSIRQKQFNPTCVEWISQQTFIHGCSNAPRGQIWNIEGKLKEKFLYDIPKGAQPQHHQINTICYNKNMKMSIFGCEDGAVRIFALNFNRLLHKIPMTSSVSCIKLMKDWQILCGNHQGGLSIYDLRNYQKIIQYEKCHLKKYDEGTLCLWSGDDRILSGGTDGLIKIFS